MLNRIFPRPYRFQCPDEHQLAAYVDQQLIGGERERVESHLAKCDSCLQQVGFLVKQAPTVAAAPVPAWLLQRAERLETPTRPSAPLDWRWVSVAAATVVVMVGVAVWSRSQRPTEEHPTTVATVQQPPAPEVRENSKPQPETAVRSISPHVSLPVVLSPQPGATVHDSDFMIRWEPIPHAAAYEVRIVTADGDLVWRKRVHETSVSPPHQTLRSGVTYFVWVRALLPDGKTQQSTAVEFIGG